MTSEVGMLLTVVPVPTGVNVRLLVNVTESVVVETPGALSVYGTVMTTGDQLAAGVSAAFGFVALQLAPRVTAPQP